MIRAQNIEASRQSLQWRLAGGNLQQAVHNRREAIDKALQEQKEEIFGELEENQENFQEQVQLTLEQMADVHPLEAQRLKAAALERKVKQLEAVQLQLLTAIQEKNDQVERLKNVVRNLIQELQDLQNRLQCVPRRYASQEQDLLNLGNFVCHGIMQKGEKV